MSKPAARRQAELRHAGGAAVAGMALDERALWERLCAAPIPDHIWPRVGEYFEAYRGERAGIAGARHRRRLEMIAQLPWATRSGGAPSVEPVRQALDARHAGLAEIKRPILEHVAVQKRRWRLGGTPTFTPLLFVGPPGVGKTSMAIAIAEGLGRPVVTMSLAAHGDAEAIRGFDIAYMGSQPGMIARMLVQAGSRDSVFCFDEVEKAGPGRGSSRGNPVDVLLEVLDPTQNGAFRDAFLDISLDLSQIVFILTANSLDLHPALLDRVQVIPLRGYHDEEKRAILRDFLVPRLLEEHALTEQDVEITEAARDLLIQHSPEPGVRGLQRMVRTLLGAATLALEEGAAGRVVIDPDWLRRRLGPPQRPPTIGFRPSPREIGR